MSRKPRIEFEGAFYHVITRGNQRQNIFKGSNDYTKYLDILSKYKKRYYYNLYAYVLMNNHVHLLIEMKEIPLSKILQGINQSYTVFFNREYKTLGHLFQGRYKSILCDKDEYLLSLLKYIHLNPVRARIVRRPEEYHWSSHKLYVMGGGRNDLVDVNEALALFSNNRSSAIKQYSDFMESDLLIKKEEVYKTVDQRILGDDDFLKKVVRKSSGKIRKGKKVKEFSLDEIGRSVGKAFGVSLAEIRWKGKSGSALLGKRLFCLTSKEYGYKGKEIAEFICKNPSVVTRYLKEKDVLENEVNCVVRLLERDMKVNNQV